MEWLLYLPLLFFGLSILYWVIIKMYEVFKEDKNAFMWIVWLFIAILMFISAHYYVIFLSNNKFLQDLLAAIWCLVIVIVLSITTALADS